MIRTANMVIDLSKQCYISVALSYINKKNIFLISTENMIIDASKRYHIHPFMSFTRTDLQMNQQKIPIIF